MFSLEDDDDFAVRDGGGSSNLASLFTSDTNASQDGNQSLMYSAPKQPKKSKQPSSTGQSGGRPQMDIIHAIAVTAFIYDGSKHIAQGKLGIALIGNHALPLYKLLLYKGQQQHVAFATITPNFQFIIQANNYATFYDDGKQNWSINFENEQAIIEFAKQICITKANITKPMESIIIQDLMLGQGEALDSRDTVEIKYTGWFLTNNKIGEVFDTNVSSDKSLRFRIHQGKCIKGIENGIVGMKKYGKRLVIVPPSLGYANIPDSDTALKTNVLVYELEIKRCKYFKDSSSSRSSTPINTDAESDKKLERNSESRSQSAASDEVSIRARGASLSEQLSQSPSKKKATIISRIVKMGQPMLPLQGAIAVQPSSESENEEEVINVTHTQRASSVTSVSDSETKPIPKPRPHQVSHVAAPVQSPVPSIQTSAQSVSVYQSPSLINPQQPHSFPISASSPFSVMPHTIASPVVVGGGDTHLQLLMTENRTLNTEMRMLLSKISDKVDTVLSKVDQPGNQQMSLPSMDVASLSFNIQRIFQENESLRKENAEKSEKIELQNEKICNLLHKNQKYMEQSTDLLEQRSSSLQSNTVQLQLKAEKLEQEKLELLKKFTDVTNMRDSIQEECVNLKETVQNLSTEKNKLLEKHQKFQQQYEELKKSYEIAEQQVMELRSNLEKEHELGRLREADLDQMKESLQKSQEMSQKYKVDDNAYESRKEYETQIATLKEQLKQSKKANVLSDSSSFIVDEVKKIMNVVYKHLQREFEIDENYSGSYISEQLMQSIRKVTLQLMEKYSQEPKSEKEVVSKIANNASDVKKESIEISENDETSHSKDEPQNLTSNEETSVEHSISDSNQKENITEEMVQKSLEDKVGNETNTNDSASESWRPQPPPPPSFMEDDEEDDWLN